MVYLKYLEELCAFWVKHDVAVVQKQGGGVKNVFSLLDKFLPDTVDVLDGITDLATHLLLITLHLRGTERESVDIEYREQK